jgi:hypothetical protein
VVAESIFRRKQNKEANKNFFIKEVNFFTNKNYAFQYKRESN